MTPDVMKLLKAGGIAPDVNNHKVLQPVPPPVPKYRMGKNKKLEYIQKLSEQSKQRTQERMERRQEQRQEQQEVRQSQGIKM